jgi:integrase
LLDAIRAGGAPKQANRVLVALKGMFGWALPRDHVFRDPCAGIKRPTKETPRDRVLTDDELKLVWRASVALSDVRRAYIRFLIVTGQRKQETARISRANIDAIGATWLIPATLAKNGKAHSVPLSELARSILAELADYGPTTAIFSTDEGETPISEFVRTLKAPLDAEMLRLAHEDAAKLKRDPKTVKPIPAWVLHDLRRTAASGMARLAIAPHVIEKVLNHSPRDISGIAAVYNRHNYETEKQAALEAWSRHVSMIVGAAMPENVVAFPNKMANA